MDEIRPYQLFQEMGDGKKIAAKLASGKVAEGALRIAMANFLRDIEGDTKKRD